MPARVLMLHGLDSEPSPEKVAAIAACGVSVCAPHLDYHLGSCFENLSSLIREQDIRAIIGSSMGGYLAFHLGNAHRLPALLFNPALLVPEVHDLQPVPAEVLTLDPYPEKVVVLGDQDRIVDFRSHCRYMTEVLGLRDGEDLQVVAGMEHRIPLEVYAQSVASFLQRFQVA